jgi:prevent-host-death family protein
MGERDIVTQTVKASAVRTRWSQIINEVARRQVRVIVEKSGVPVAAIVSTDDLERLEQLDYQRRERLKTLDESQAVFQDLPDTEIEAEVARALAEVRAEHRRRRATRPG